MNVGEYVARMEEIADTTDLEVSHMEGDDLLEQLIREHLPEFAPVLDAYAKCGKWYA